jgi:hypothetical protein
VIIRRHLFNATFTRKSSKINCFSVSNEVNGIFLYFDEK